MYRSHLANVYRALDLRPPDELSRPILKTLAAELHTEPAASIHPTVDGRITSYFEWMGSGLYQIDGRSGSMHGKRSPVREVHYGGDGNHLFLRVDFHDMKETLSGVEVDLTVQASPVNMNGSLGMFDASQAFVTSAEFAGAKCAFQNILEAGVPLTAAGATPGQLSVSNSRCGRMACPSMPFRSKAG